MAPTLIKRNPVDAILADDPDAAEQETETLPPTWNGMHVGLRLTEGFIVFRHMQLRDYSTEARTAWPPYMYEFSDLVAQGVINEQGEVMLEKTMAEKNRTRVSPSMREITRAVEVSYWPARYLSFAHPRLCEAVNAVALAHALGLDAGWVTRKRGGYADTWRARHDQGCELIARWLVADRVSVF